ncbi:nitroreductase family protein [Alkalibacter rhizosphaerae]|uniref:Nitroreductase family protein n=1 Tax=Alkalibacter rhizosphaerae TaxID=2815577 RepID=A0A975AI86_9FIRM|nr:nitroreductase family protein [Alkalibacter rhizosphaerae]QSX08813.1 nitroreductase family protein [Alkalibacter rhizosphaerae]
MTLRKILTERKSIREFKEKNVPLDTLQAILTDVQYRDALVKDTDLEAMLLEDGDWACKILEGIAGYNGHMVKAPHYVLFLSKEIANHQIQTGYYAESLMLKLAMADIDSCWLNVPEDGSDVKEALGISDEREAAALIAVGYKKWDKKVINPLETGQNYSKATLKVVDDNTSYRLKPEELVYLDEWGKNPTWDELRSYGLEDVFHYVRFAPSTLNRQPWRFILRNKKIYVAIRKDEELKINAEHEMLEAGIIMFYLEKIMSEYGLQGSWTLVPRSGKDQGIPADYFVPGYFSRQ